MPPSLQVTCGPVALRPIPARAANQLLQLARDPALTEFLQWRPHRSVCDSLTYIRDAGQLWRRRTAFLFGVFDVRDGRLLGGTGVSSIDRANRRGEVGTWIGVPYQGAGLNRPVKAAVLAFAFHVLALGRVEMVVRTDNERSLQAMSTLPGVRDEGLQRARLVDEGRTFDARMFAITTTDWSPAEWPPVHVTGSLG